MQHFTVFVFAYYRSFSSLFVLPGVATALFILQHTPASLRLIVFHHLQSTAGNGRRSTLYAPWRNLFLFVFCFFPSHLFPQPSLVQTVLLDAHEGHEGQKSRVCFRHKREKCDNRDYTAELAGIRTPRRLTHKATSSQPQRSQASRM